MPGETPGEFEASFYPTYFDIPKAKKMIYEENFHECFSTDFKDYHSASGGTLDYLKNMAFAASMLRKRKAPDEFLNLCRNALASYPGLSGNGYPAQPDEPGEEYALVDRFDVVYRVYHVVAATLKPIKTLDRSGAGPQLKSLIKDILGEYVTHGEIILAMILLGYEMDKNGKRYRNFNFSKKSYLKLEEIRHTMRQMHEAHMNSNRP